MMRICVFAAICLITTALTSSPTMAGAGKRYALIVGVKTYRPGQPLPELPFTENDASGLAKTLEAGGYQVTLMTQAVGRTEGKEVLAPMSDFIRDQLDAMLDNPFLTDEDVVIVALAGHGVQYELAEGDGDNAKKTPKFYFCPGDADIAKLRTANEVADRNRLLDLGELYDALNKCKAGGKLLLVDACRNDPTKPSVTRSLASATLPPLPPPPGGTAAFFSCSAHQKAFEDGELNHGVFFHHVIEALKGDADSSTAKRAADGQITLSELSEHVSSSTYDYVRSKYSGAKQAPELKGEFRLTVPLIEVAKNPGLQTDVTNNIGMNFRLIPAGQFAMGSPQSASELVEQFPTMNPEYTLGEQPVHRVSISRPFYLGKFEVTKGQYMRFLNESGYETESKSANSGIGLARNAEGQLEHTSGAQFQPWSWGFENETERHPVTNVSWNDAVEFCRWLSRNEGKTFRLPTEAEWEYACRARTVTLFWNGDDVNRVANVENVLDSSAYGVLADNFFSAPAESTDGYALTAPVGSFPANPFGLHDMQGNVAEWCHDWLSEDFYSRSPGIDPVCDEPGESRVCRGGSFDLEPIYARSANRFEMVPPDSCSCRIGFRVVMEIER